MDIKELSQNDLDFKKIFIKSNSNSNSSEIHNNDDGKSFGDDKSLVSPSLLYLENFKIPNQNEKEVLVNKANSKTTTNLINEDQFSCDSQGNEFCEEENNEENQISNKITILNSGFQASRNMLINSKHMQPRKSMHERYCEILFRKFKEKQ